jgi:hypothetical protein
MKQFEKGEAMECQNISVSKFDRVNVQEVQKTEFKCSISISPETHASGAKHMFIIAKTHAVAKFMFVAS